MKNNRGFTIIEIITVIVFIILIGGITIPTIIKNNQKQKEKEYTKLVENINSGAEVFIEKYKEEIEFNPDNEYYVRLNVLQQIGIIDLSIKDPRSNKEINSNVCVKVTKDDMGLLTYEYLEDTSECKNNKSNIIFNLDTNPIFVAQNSEIDLTDYAPNSTYTSEPPSDLKLYIYDESGNEIDKLNTTTTGIKRIKYIVKDENNDVETEPKEKEFKVINLSINVGSNEVLAKGQNVDLNSYDVSYELKPNQEELELTSEEKEILLNLKPTPQNTLNTNNIGEKEVNYKVEFKEVNATAKKIFNIIELKFNPGENVIKKINTPVNPLDGVSFSINPSLNSLSLTPSEKTALQNEIKSLSINTTNLNNTTTGIKTINYSVSWKGKEFSGTKNFEFIDDPKINIVFFADSNTSSDLQSSNLSTWANELSNKLTSSAKYKEKSFASIGIKYNVTTTKKYSSLGNIEYSKEEIGEMPVCKSTDNEYLGIFDNMIVIHSKKKSDYCDNKYIFLNIDTKVKQSLNNISNCGYENANNIYCIASSSGSTPLFPQGGSGTTYYHYIVVNNSNKLFEQKSVYGYDYYYNGSGTAKYTYTYYIEENNTITQAQYYCERKAGSSKKKCNYKIGNENIYSRAENIYNNVQTKYNNISETWNTHVNPTDKIYPFTKESKLFDKLIELNFVSEEHVDDGRYDWDDKKNIFYDNDKGNGYLYFGHGSDDDKTYKDAYILWENRKENFILDLASYKNGYDKTYLVVLANNTNNYNQNINFTNLNNVKTYVYGDEFTKNKLNITNSNEYTYTNLNSILNDLKNKINAT